MKKKKYFYKLKKIIFFITNAQKLAKEIGIKNLSQPGIIKEMITAYNLKHRIHPTKKEHDAEDFNNPEVKFEYLSCLENKSFQFDRVDDKNLKTRIKKRNTAVFCAVFDKKEQLKLLRVYRVEPNALYGILQSKYKKSSSTSRHVGITENELKSLIPERKRKLLFRNKQ